MKNNSGLIGGALTAETSSVWFMNVTRFAQNRASPEGGGAIVGLVKSNIFFLWSYYIYK